MLSTLKLTLPTLKVSRSYPNYKPPKDIVLPYLKEEWWAKAYEENCDVLHKIHFYRVILDEAQAIKNHASQTSKACRALMCKHRWALSGTPIQNAVGELYPYFKFLQVKHTGSFEEFKEDFCGEDEDSKDRLQYMLKQFMIRRTYQNQIFGAPILKLPKITQKTCTIEFNSVERRIYEAVKNRYIQHINSRSRAGTLEKSYRNVLTMLLRLRQLTAHAFLVQETIEYLFETEDVENIASEVIADDSPAKDMLKAMREMIAGKDRPAEPAPTTEAVPPIDEPPSNKSMLIFEFRMYLRALAKSSRWSELKDRSVCLQNPTTGT